MVYQQINILIKRFLDICQLISICVELNAVTVIVHLLFVWWTPIPPRNSINLPWYRVSPPSHSFGYSLFISVISSVSSWRPLATSLWISLCCFEACPPSSLSYVLLVAFTASMSFPLVCSWSCLSGFFDLYALGSLHGFDGLGLDLEVFIHLENWWNPGKVCFLVVFCLYVDCYCVFGVCLSGSPPLWVLFSVRCLCFHEYL